MWWLYVYDRTTKNIAQVVIEMAIIGWLALAALLASVSLSWFMLAVNGLGKYNIGGVENSWKGRVFILSLAAAIVYGWVELVAAAPFAIIVN